MKNDESSPLPRPFKKQKRRRRDYISKNSRICIVGSGLGGLATAINLEMSGFSNVVLFERDDESARRKGYGLTLTYNPKGPLQRLGLLEKVASLDCPSRSHYLFRSDGSILSYYGNAFCQKRGSGQRGNLRLPRQVLRKLLMEKVQSPIFFGKKLIQVEQQQPTSTPQDDNDENYCLPPPPQLKLIFEDGSSESNIDLLVGADGIRSSVARSLFPEDNNNNGLNYLGIFIILGIADFCHPLLDERGFYTLDGNHRLFTMPYEGCRVDDNPSDRRIMWQLSYRLEDIEKANLLKSAGSQVLKKEVLQRCSSWHDPVLKMINSTPLDTIWGTALMDRDPKDLMDQLLNRSSKNEPTNAVAADRIVLVGDSFHAMSPFKGQGANQALLDGPLLASWLQRASLESARKGFLREMMQRTRKRVLASREAARLLHSNEILMAQQEFAGVIQHHIPNLLKELRQSGIDASCGSELDTKVSNVIHQMGIKKEYNVNSSVVVAKEEGCNKKKYDAQQRQALYFAAKGDTQSLRNLSLSLQHSDEECVIKSARNTHYGQTCLHVAAAARHYDTCRWLLTEVFMDANIPDKEGKSAYQVALEGGVEQIIALFTKASSTEYEKKKMEL